MNIDDKIEFVRVLTAVAEIYKEKLSEHRIALYFEILKSHGIDEIKKALLAHCEDTKKGFWFPLPSNISLKIEELYGSKSSTADLAQEAWATVLNKLSRIGSSATPKFDEVTTQSINAMGGWGNLCTWKNDQLDFKYKNFVATYCFFHDQQTAKKMIERQRQDCLQ